MQRPYNFSAGPATIAPEVLAQAAWVSIRTGVGRLKIGVNVGNTISAGFRSHNE